MPMKIALVDDDPRALAQLEQYLTEQLGRETEISHYGSGEALLADWRPGAFELVVLDIYMGGATGMEVARRLRADDGQVRLAFATSSNDFASESYEVGACYYLRKPFRPEGVRAMLERLDLEALFGNLLENALAACMQEASPRIVVRITADAHTLCAAVDNTFTGTVRRTTGGFLSTKHAGLGLGTASVRSIAEKYHGVCRLEPRDGMFCASVLLELPQEKL